MPPLPPPGRGGPTGSDFVSLVSAQIGTPYVWGGDKPGGFDCSGLVYWAAHILGLSHFPRTSEEQWGAVQRIDGSQLQPGDLIFLNFPGEVSPGHVVIYAGGDQIIQAPSTGQLVQRDTFGVGTFQQWGATVVGYGRIPGLNYSGEPRIPGGAGTTVGGQVPSGGTVSGVTQDIWGFLQLPLKSLASVGDVPSAILALAAPFVKIAEAIDWLLHPSHWIRIFAGVGGSILVLMGIWQLTHAGAA